MVTDSKYLLIAGCDEAGRGPLAGPVIAAAVVLLKKNKILGLGDSKKLTQINRDLLRIEIEKNSLSYGIASVSNEEIDQINILQASIKAMHKALDKLSVMPNKIQVDGNKFNPYNDIDFETIVKGDSFVNPISAASILAKTYRDQIMLYYHEVYPNYGFDKHKGYPTKLHYQALDKYGPCPIHRKTFLKKYFQSKLLLELE